MHEQSVSWKDIIFMKVKTILSFIYKQINEEPVPTNVIIKFTKHSFNCIGYARKYWYTAIILNECYCVNTIFFFISNEHCNFSKYLIIVFVYVICQGINNSNHGSNLFVILLHSPEIFRTKIHSPNQTLCVYYSPRMWDLGLIMR